jgi:hypothetical protein
LSSLRTRFLDMKKKTAIRKASFRFALCVGIVLITDALPASADSPAAVESSPPASAAAPAQSANGSTDPHSDRRAPALATSPPPATSERRSTAAIVSGIVLVSASGLALLYVGGTAMGDCASNCDSRDSLDRGLLIGTAAGLLIGIPLIVYGAKRVPTESGAVQMVPRWAGGPTTTGWGWRF